MVDVVTREYLVLHTPSGAWNTITFLDTETSSTIQVVHDNGTIGHMSVDNAIDVLTWTSRQPDFEVVEI